MKKVELKTNKGFTLVELIVAMSIFLVAIVIIVGVFVRSLRTQRIVNHLMAVNSNTSLVIEQMAREIRTSYEFKLNPAGSACVGGQREELEFTNSKGNKVFYHEEGGAIAREECAGEDCTSSSFEPLTASNITVDRLCFLNTGNPNNNKDPWRVTIFLTVDSSNPQLAGNIINFQTTVGARILPKDLE